VCPLQQFRNRPSVGDVVDLVVGAVAFVVTAALLLWVALFLVAPCDETEIMLCF